MGDLKRTLKVVVEPDKLEDQVQARLKEMGPKVRLKGFRPGKVPPSELRARFIRQILPEVVEQLVGESGREALEAGHFRPAVAPRVTVGSSLDDLIKGAPLEYEMSFEVMPSIALQDFGAIKLRRFVSEVTQADVQKELSGLGEGHRRETPKKSGEPAGVGDVVYVDFTGRRDGQVFEGGRQENVRLVLGSGDMLEDFEKGIEGVVGGDERVFEVVFPKTHGRLGGQTVSFEVAVHRVMALGAPPEGEELAKALGFEDAAQMHNGVKERCLAQDRHRTRGLLKEQLVKAFEGLYDFPLPEGLVEEEIARLLQEAGVPEAERSENREKVLPLAERQVRLAVLGSEIAHRHGLGVSDEELAGAARALGASGQAYLKSSSVRRALRTRLLEEKVVDFVLERVTVEERDVSRESLYSSEILGDA